MRYLFIALLLFGFSSAVIAQANQNTLSSSTDSDPAAKDILKKMRDKYQSLASLSVDFDLTIKFPNEIETVESINFMQKGDGYRVEMAGRTIFSDGTTLWMVQERNKEIQINDVPDSADDVGILSPASMFSLYEREDFAFYLVGQTTENGKVVQKIEFKPLSADSDYSKMRLTIIKGSNEFVRVKAFGKDGARFTVSAKKITPNKNIAASLFTYNKADYPDYYVEDLRD